jgi:S1-C subfamily serine protease
MFQTHPMTLLVAFAAVAFSCACSEPSQGQGSDASPPPTTAETDRRGASGLGLQDRLEQIHGAAGRSVVNITTKVVSPHAFSMPMPQQGSGSGFVYDREGHVVTAAHVIRNAEEVLVSFGDGDVQAADIVGTDALTDVAVVKVEREVLPDPLPLGDSDDLRVGEFVVALGNPFGLHRTLTFGVVSALGRTIQQPGGAFLSEAIQTDTPMNPGSSGGPLLDLDQRVVGVNSMIVSPSGASSGVGFAVAANTVKKVVPVLIEEGDYPHPWIGIQTLSLNRGWHELLAQAGVSLPVDEGLMVVKVVPGSPAAEAGLRGGDELLRIGNVELPVGGDVVVAVDGQPVRSHEEMLLHLESEVAVGETIELTYYRDDDERTAPLTVEERPDRLEPR